MRDLKQSKAILARLFSQENLNVVHSSTAQTASFDLKSRTLTCPVWENMDGSIYDLLMGHETGHALYTPAEGWHDAVTANSHAKFKPTLNIVEDARIEKLQKNKYPGLRRSFYQAYSELMRRDFFGVNSRPEIIEHLNLVDRVNLHFKVGSMLGIKFTAEEQKLVDRIEKITEWDDVVTISQELFDYVKDNEQDKINSVDELKKLIENLEDFLDEDGEVGDEQPFPIDFEESNEEDEGDTEEGDDAPSNGSDAQDEQDEQEQEDKDPPTSEEISDKIKEILEKMHEEATASDEEGVSSVTDSIFREKEKELIENEKNPTIHVDLPEPIMKNIVLPFKETYADFVDAMNDSLANYNRTEHHCGRQNGFSAVTIDMVGADFMKDFNSRNKSYISLLIKSFEMYKNANQYARERSARTGELDTRKLHRYQMTNDIFRKVTTTDKGKSHGMILFLDMSGSMNSNFDSSMEQILLLTAFCKAVNIPFEVYGFCNASSRGYSRYFTREKKFTSVPGVTLSFVDDKYFHLKELISSKMNAREYKKAFEMLLIVSKTIGSDYYRASSSWGSSIKKYVGLSFNRVNAGFDMNSTPFIEATVCSLKLIESFRSKFRSDIVNVVYVSDGDGDASAYINHGYERIDRGSKIILREKNSNEKVFYRCEERAYSLQNSITELVRKATGVQHIGFYLCHSHRDFSHKLQKDDASKSCSRFRADGFVELPSMGYDSYYFINQSFNKKGDKYVIEKDDNASKTAKKFAKAQTNKHAARSILSKFAKQVAA